MRYHRLLCNIFLIALLAGHSSASDQNESAETRIQITVGLVQVDAVVTDRQGNQVRDLQPEDFSVYQDGEARPVTRLAYVDTSSSSQADQGFGEGPRLRELDRSRIRRSIAVVVDDLGMSLFGVNQVRKRLRQLVDERLGEDDLMAIIRTSAGTGTLTGFTSDRRRLHGALDDLWWRPGWGVGTASAATALQSNLDKNIAASRRPSPAGFLRSSVDSPEQHFERRVLAGSLGALQHTLRGMRELPARKAVLFFSESAFLFKPETTANRSLDLLARPERDRLDLYRLIVDDANRAGVVIYGMDPRGVGGGVDPFPENSHRLSFGAAQDGLQFLARQTGGLFLSNSNDIAGLVGQAMDDMSGYYLLGYAPDSETFDRRFHKIQVKVTKPGLKIRSRRGFYGYEDNERTPRPPATREEKLRRALYSPFGSDEIGVHTSSLYALNDDGKPTIQSLTRIDASDLTFIENDEGLLEARVDLLSAAFDVAGRAIESVDQVFVATVRPERLAHVREAGLLHTTLYPLKKPGAYQFRLAVQDVHSGRLGSASQFVETPRFDKKHRLATSGIVLGSASHLGEGAASSGDPDPRGSPALRMFRPGERVYYWRQIFNARTNKTTGERSLVTRSRLYRNGELLQENAPFPFKPTRVLSSDVVEDVRLYDLGADLKAGLYVLEVETRDLLADPAKGSVRGWIDFRILKP